MTDEQWLPINLAMICPGLGQFYSGQRSLGLAIGLTVLGLVTMGVWHIFAPTGNTVTGLGCIGLAIAAYGLSLIALYRWSKAHAGVADQALTTLAKNSRHPWFAVFLSHVLPGLGQFYLQSPIWAALFLGALLLTSVLAPLYPALIGVPPLIWMAACYHAYWAARPGRSAQRTHRLLWALILAIGLTRLGAGLAPIGLNAIVYRFIVPSESMVPTLTVADQMFVTPKRPYRPHPGDIIVFQVPPQAQTVLGTQPDTFFVKRVIALPGQTVQVRAGQVWINDRPWREPYIAARPDYDWGPAVVPADALFVLGDNRNASADSHVWGFLPIANVVGRAYKIYWPPSRIQAIVPPGDRP